MDGCSHFFVLDEQNCSKPVNSLENLIEGELISTNPSSKIQINSKEDDIFTPQKQQNDHIVVTIHLPDRDSLKSEIKLALSTNNELSSVKSFERELVELLKKHRYLGMDAETNQPGITQSIATRKNEITCEKVVEINGDKLVVKLKKPEKLPQTAKEASRYYKNFPKKLIDCYLSEFKLSGSKKRQDEEYYKHLRGEDTEIRDRATIQKITDMLQTLPQFQHEFTKFINEIDTELFIKGCGEKLQQQCYSEMLEGLKCAMNYLSEKQAFHKFRLKHFWPKVIFQEIKEGDSENLDQSGDSSFRA